MDFITFNPHDVLPTIAEMAITMAGFIGIVVGLGARSGRPFQGQNRLRIIMILIITLSAAFSAVLPFAVVGFGGSMEQAWAAVLLIHGSVCLSQNLAVFYLHLTGRWDFVAPIISISLQAVMIFLSALALLSGLGWILPYSPGVAILQLGWTVVLGGFAVVGTAIATISGKEITSD